MPRRAGIRRRLAHLGHRDQPAGSRQAGAGLQPQLDRVPIGDQQAGAQFGVDRFERDGVDAVGTEVPGSAAYVAIERIAGTLDGRRGSFLTQHNGILDRGQATLALTVVPDSGTGELAGLRGRMAIDIVDGAHCYAFDYALDDAGGRE